MNKINDGGPAFPSGVAMATNVNHEPMVVDSVDRAQGGMSLRDWFAGQALNGCLASDENEPCASRDAEGIAREIQAHRDCLAKAAYGYADALLAARERPTP